MEISFYIYYDYARRAGVAQLVEHLIRNEGVVGSSPITGTRIKNRDFYRGFYFIVYAVEAISLRPWPWWPVLPYARYNFPALFAPNP